MDNTEKHIDPVALLPKYFANEATPDEKQFIEEWRLSNVENSREFDAFAKLWGISGPVSGKADIDIDKEWLRMEKAIEPAKGRTIKLVRVLQIAASVIFISVLAYLGISYSGTTTIKSPIAETRAVKLPDGSVISLNAGSKITYKKGFGKDQRNITLKGEAFFEVSKNANLPFIISANNASIKVVGTKFNVKAFKGSPEVKVLVTEGIVKVYETKQPEKEITLTAWESGSYNKQQKAVKKNIETNLNDISWKTMVIDFKNNSLSEVASVLENTYHYKIELAPEIASCPITVEFNHQDLPSVLKVLKSTLNLKISIDEKRIKLSGNGCSNR